jgi:hypothetical protein
MTNNSTLQVFRYPLLLSSNYPTFSRQKVLQNLAQQDPVVRRGWILHSRKTLEIISELCIIFNASGDCERESSEMLDQG